MVGPVTSLQRFYLKQRQRRRRGERGQALVEFTLTVTFLLLLLSVVLDLGRAFFFYVALHNAAGEGALYGSAFPTRFTHVAGSPSADPNNITYRTRNESMNGLINWSTATITPSWTDSNSNGLPDRGEMIAVRISYPFNLIGPLPKLLGVPTQFTMVARAQQVILAQP